jgi:hypothetical protein
VDYDMDELIAGGRRIERATEVRKVFPVFALLERGEDPAADLGDEVDGAGLLLDRKRGHDTGNFDGSGRRKS